jgi:hypothetical protein
MMKSLFCLLLGSNSAFGFHAHDVEGSSFVEIPGLNVKAGALGGLIGAVSGTSKAGGFAVASGTSGALTNLQQGNTFKALGHGGFALWGAKRMFSNKQ